MTEEKVVLVLEDLEYIDEILEDSLNHGEVAGVVKSLQNKLPESPLYTGYDVIMDSMLAHRVTLILEEDFKPTARKLAAKYATVK